MAVDSTKIAAGLDRAATVIEDGLMPLATVRVVDRDEPTFDTSAGEWSTAVETTLYEGIGYFRLGQARPVKSIELGESLNTTREWRLRVPRGTVSFPNGSIVEILTAQRAPEMVGKKFRIDDYPEGALSVTPHYIMVHYEPREHEVP